MKTKFCRPNYGVKIEKLRATRLQLCPPPIPFERKDDPNAKVTDEDESKFKKKTFTLRHDPNDKESRTYEYTISIFEEGDPESFIRWIMEVEQEILPNYPAKSPEMKLKIFRMVLGGHARERFVATTLSCKGDAQTKLQEEINAVRLHVFGGDKNVYRRQKSYLRQELQLQFGKGNVMKFRDRLLDLNYFLKYFPPSPDGVSPRELPENE